MNLLFCIELSPNWKGSKGDTVEFVYSEVQGTLDISSL
jgi:hypothetical protein